MNSINQIQQNDGNNRISLINGLQAGATSVAPALTTSTSINTSGISITKPVQSNIINFTRTISQSSEQTSASPIVLANPNELNNLIASVQNSSNTNLIYNEQQQQPHEHQSYIKIRDYVFFESLNSTNDSFSTAYNLKESKFYYWKRFERKDYMKKLEAYFILEGSERVYKFNEIIIDETYPNGSEKQYAYVIYEPHYGDLHTYMKEKKRLDEPEARYIFKQCVEAVTDCHDNGIIIRDIKLKKFVFVDAERTKVVLSNLEDCLVLDDDATSDLIRSQQGCPAYVSPEVLNPYQSSYSGRLSDSWSLGVILFTLLLGRYPFHHPTISTMFAKITRGKFQIPPSSNLSTDSKLLLRSLIRVKPEERLLPNEILAHNWLKQNDYEYQSYLYQNYVNKYAFNTNLSLNKNANNNNNININSLFINQNMPSASTGISLSLSSNLSNITTSFNNNLFKRETNTVEGQMVPLCVSRA